MGRPPKDRQLLVEAIVWLDRTGVPWRDLPGEFGPWATVASRFYRWRRQGVWDRVLQALQAAADARGELNWRPAGPMTLTAFGPVSSSG